MKFSNFKNHFFLFFLIFAVNTSAFCVNENNKEGQVYRFNTRAIHLDLRSQVMKMQALMNLAENFSNNGINTIIMEWEDTFPYKSPHSIISGKYSYTRDEIVGFITYCSNMGIDVIPLQQTFGHVEYILRYDKYQRLSENFRDRSQVDPSKQRECVNLFTELITDVISLHKSMYFHIGCDETRLLGNCSRCADFVKENGKSKLFVNYVKEICKIVIDNGKIPIMWADMLLKYPEVADQLPSETVFIDWNYWTSQNEEKQKIISSLQEKGFKFWGAGSLRSDPDNLYLTKWEDHFKNQDFFIPYANKMKYEGFIMTSWSTSGLYNYIWDYPPHEIIHLEEIRNVYPLSGFQILLDYYFKNLKVQNSSIDFKTYILKYSKEKFGLTDSDAEVILAMFVYPPHIISFGKIVGSDKSLVEYINDGIKIQTSLKKIKFRHNKDEFAHLLLMFDMRMNYLKFKHLESKYNRDQENIKDLLIEIIKIKKEADEINSRFLKLNNKDYYQKELEHFNKMRTFTLNETYRKIKRLADK